MKRLIRHYVKGVCIWSFSGTHFSAYVPNTEGYGVCNPNAGKYDQVYSEYGHFSRTEDFPTRALIENYPRIIYQLPSFKRSIIISWRQEKCSELGLTRTTV